MTRSVDEVGALAGMLDTKAFAVPHETPLKNRVRSAKEEGTIQVQIEVTATRLG